MNPNHEICGCSYLDEVCLVGRELQLQAFELLGRLVVLEVHPLQIEAKTGVTSQTLNEIAIGGGVVGGFEFVESGLVGRGLESGRAVCDVD